MSAVTDAGGEAVVPPVELDAGAPAPGEGAAVVDGVTAPVADPGAATAPEPAPAEEAPAEETAPAPTFVVVDVLDVALDLPSQYPLVTLQESDPPLRSLVFPVGLPEGTALSYALRRLSTPRPLSHTLFAEILGRYHVDLVAVRLTGRVQGTYLAELDLMAAAGREVVPCRPTDGLTLALRMPVPAPVLCDERLLSTTGDVEPG